MSSGTWIMPAGEASVVFWLLIGGGMKGWFSCGGYCIGGGCCRGLMAPFIAPAMNSFSKAAIRCCMAWFSSSRRLFLFSRCRMYSVALLKTYFEGFRVPLLAKGYFRDARYN